ncbi:phosphoglucosamine mutase [Zavarzinella formosa]|uniref:phosphoglucosamine mutase n=1 Tax=Zavarzinella formosa TaxID=360055 RepID=UPI0002F25EAD|nr:phosphoglucosamine mutase [Zavarzinella formosa]
MSQPAPSDLIVSVSGIRGLVGQSLTPDRVSVFAAALGTYLKGGRVVVSRDSRPSGRMLRQAVIAGLTSTGCSVEDIGIAPTPTVGVAVRELGAAGAIQITASHNPAPWNGLKMFGADGAVLSAERGLHVKRLFESGPLHYATWDKIGETRVPPDVTEDHLKLVCDIVSVANLCGSAFRVLLDGNGGAGGPLGTLLLQQLGCEIIEQGCDSDGVFLHEAEPIPAHLQDVAPQVQRSGAAVGFVLDPDADRLALIDEKGVCVSEELTLALAVKYRLAQKRGPVVINMSTSRVIEDLARDANSECFRTAVGEANVVAGMKASQAVIGGEGNGGVIDPRVGWVRDPFVAMPMILSLMAETGLPLSELIAGLPQYSMLKTKYTVPKEKLASVLTAIESRWPEAKVNKQDGLRLDWSDRWIHVRSSNTEPVVRIIAEAPTADEAKTLCDAAAEFC